MYPPLKNIPMKLKSYEIQVENSPWNLKIRNAQYMDKTNGKNFKLFEIKKDWWLTPLLSPKEMRIQSP